MQDTPPSYVLGISTFTRSFLFACGFKSYLGDIWHTSCSKAVYMNANFKRSKKEVEVELGE